MDLHRVFFLLYNEAYERYDSLGCNATCVVRREPDVSEGFTASIFMVEDYTKQEISKSRRQTEPQIQQSDLYEGGADKSLAL
jgi:hypothetical protein